MNSSLGLGRHGENYGRLARYHACVFGVWQPLVTA